MSSTHQTLSSEPPLRNLLGMLFLLWLVVFTITLTGYPDLTDNERRVGGYILDAVQNHHWFIQRDAMGEIASKPPMLTWLAGLVTLAMGHITRFGIYLPSALATLGAAWAIFFAGRKHFGWLSGFLGGLSYLLCPISVSQMTTARYDGLFTFPILLGALAAFHAWNHGRGWTWFWLASTFATLVKGPLGLVLAAAGLLAAIWEWRSGKPLRPRGNHLAGIALYLLICGGWLALAYWQMGQPVVDKLIGRELLRHSIGGEDGGLGSGFYKPTVSILSNYLPWSWFALLAFWRVWKEPSSDDETRRFERFLFCGFFVGLLMFSISSHQRARLSLPLMPAVVLLSGREIARWTAAWSRRKLWTSIACLAVFGLSLLTVHRHVLLARDHNVKDTLAMQTMADTVRSQLGESFPLAHVDAPYCIQFYLNTYRPWISQTQAVELLRGNAAVFLVVRNMDLLRKNLGPDSPPVYEFLSEEMHDGFTIRIVSNHPKLEWTSPMAAIFGPVQLRMEGVKLLQQTGNDLVFERLNTKESAVFISNISQEPQRVRIKFSDDEARGFQEHQLAPGESWRP